MINKTQEIEIKENETVTTCISHTCSDCGEKLSTQTFGQKLFITACMFVLTLLFILFLVDTNLLSDDVWCKTETIQNDIIISHTVECPK